ncbi:MAG: prepilin-type N-terminal cleavage/methylation domain-containing protein [Proteobacteria bacterium]|nr:prepilin-type N-terminal cleavage/methylation domain-containing protein [Pseudomonadota bacterium]NCA28190.1 prepilin-type N-terminal cleavage/methylation domain-containing protein [Pseudomonadota bacterium]
MTQKLHKIKKPNIKAFSLVEISVVILIIGILIVGISSGADLYNDMRLTNAKNLTLNSRVGRISDLTFWVETTLDRTIVNSSGKFNLSDGNSISAWNDVNQQSLNRISLSQATSANQPTYKASGINGIPSISFNGSQNLLSSITPIFASDKEYTLIAVWRTNNGSSTFGQIILSQSNNTTSANDLGSLFIGTNASFGFAGNNNDYLPVTASANTNYISIATINNNLTSNNISLYINSNTPSTGSTSAPASLNLGAQKFSVGSRIDSLQFFNGLISEIIIFDKVLNSAEIKSINLYLQTKYSIKVS